MLDKFKFSNTLGLEAYNLMLLHEFVGVLECWSTGVLGLDNMIL